MGERTRSIRGGGGENGVGCSEEICGEGEKKVCEGEVKEANWRETVASKPV